MKILADTSVWSLALRRKDPDQHPAATELAELIVEGRVVMLGAIRQELLSGVRGSRQFNALRDRLRPFPDFPLTAEDYENAAACFNRCRTQGIQGSNTDFLICAVALHHGLGIFTTDRDFHQFAQVLPLVLHPERTR